MATAARIGPPYRARIDGALQSSQLSESARIVHLGQSAVVLHSPGLSPRDPVLLTVTDGAVGVTPGGMSIPDPSAFERVRAALRAAGLGRVVDLSQWMTRTKLVAVDLRLMPQRLESATVRAVAHELATANGRDTVHAFDGGLARVRARAGDLATAALALEPDSVVADIIGAGPGTTPSGDDMIVGCLAALAVLGRPDAASRLSLATVQRLAATTIAARHYLAAAASGRFAEHVHALVAGFAMGTPADRILDDARCWGATSGVDLLTGLASTLHADLSPGSKRGAA